MVRPDEPDGSAGPLPYRLPMRVILAEAKARDAKSVKEAIPHWNAAMQGWRAWATEYKVAIDNLKAKGMAVNDISAAEQTRMRERVRPVYDKNATVIGEDTVKLMQAELAKLRK